jgi:hypothetical protein
MEVGFERLLKKGLHQADSAIPALGPTPMECGRQDLGESMAIWRPKFGLTADAAVFRRTAARCRIFAMKTLRLWMATRSICH